MTFWLPIKLGQVERRILLGKSSLCRVCEGKVSIVTADAIRDMGYQRGMIGIIGLIGVGYSPEGSIPYMTCQNIRRLLSDTSFCDAPGILLKFRMVKNEEEILVMDKLSEMVNIEIDAVRRCARPGVHEREIYAELFDASLRTGSDMGCDNYGTLYSGKGYPVN